LKDPDSLEGMQGEDFDAWWNILQTYMHDRPEKVEDTERTIHWVGALLINVQLHGMCTGKDKR
jgi:hypothetical protein